MDFDLIIDNEYSMKDNKIYIPSRPTIPSNSKNIEYITIPGRNSTLSIFNGYLDRVLPVTFNFYETENIPLKIRNISHILLNSKTIKFTDDIDVFYKVKNTSISEVVRTMKNFASFKVEFILEPFSYLNSSKFEITNSQTITNQGTYESEPYLKIYGNGNVQISINSYTFQINNIDEYVEIDSSLLMCYKGTVNKGVDMLGVFPKFDIGENNIKLSSNITKIEITPNWRCL